MTTIYLHIGMPKTGTTSLQNFLSNNSEKLLEKGYLYPISGRMNAPQKITDQHQGLVQALLKTYDPKSPWVNTHSDVWEGSWEDLKREIETFKPKTVIISSEVFTMREDFYNPDLIALTKRMLEKHETKIVIYIRRQDVFFRSWYSEKMKNHTRVTSNMREMILQWKERVNYYSTIELWKKSFGINNLIVRPFEKEQLKNGSIVDDFLEIINLNLNGNNFNFNPSNKKNISYCGKVIKLINLIEQLTLLKWLQKNKNYWDWYKKFAFLRKIMYWRIKLAIILSPFIPDFLINEQLLSQEYRYSIMQEFEESNRKVAQDYLGREDGKLFYSKIITR